MAMCILYVCVYFIHEPAYVRRLCIAQISPRFILFDIRYVTRAISNYALSKYNCELYFDIRIIKAVG